MRVGEVAHVCVDGHAVGRQLGGGGGVDEEAVDARVGLVQLSGAGDGVPEGAVDHGGREGHEVEGGLFVLYEIPCWGVAQSVVGLDMIVGITWEGGVSRPACSANFLLAW